MHPREETRVRRFSRWLPCDRDKVPLPPKDKRLVHLENALGDQARDLERSLILEQGVASQDAATPFLDVRLRSSRSKCASIVRELVECGSIGWAVVRQPPSLPAVS